MARHYITVIGSFSVELEPFLTHPKPYSHIRDYLMRLTTIFLNEADGAVYYLWNGDRNEKFSFQNLTNPA